MFRQRSLVIKILILLPRKQQTITITLPLSKIPGEAGCASVHGANRLGANSLLDLVVFGRTAAETVAELVKPNSPPVKLPANAGEKALKRLDHIRHKQGTIPTAKLRQELQRTMQKHAPVYRNSKDLADGCTAVRNVVKK